MTEPDGPEESDGPDDAPSTIRGPSTAPIWSETHLTSVELRAHRWPRLMAPTLTVLIVLGAVLWLLLFG